MVNNAWWLYIGMSVTPTQVLVEKGRSVLVPPISLHTSSRGGSGRQAPMARCRLAGWNTGTCAKHADDAHKTQLRGDVGWRTLLQQHASFNTALKCKTVYGMRIDNSSMKLGAGQYHHQWGIGSKVGDWWLRIHVHTGYPIEMEWTWHHYFHMQLDWASPWKGARNHIRGRELMNTEMELIMTLRLTRHALGMNGCCTLRRMITWGVRKHGYCLINVHHTCYDSSMHFFDIPSVLV